MDVLTPILNSLASLWWAPLVVVIVSIMRLPKVRGAIGEWVVHRTLTRKLDPRHYTVFHDVLLPHLSGTTQIDHIVVSTRGIFVIETKHMRGWIFGRTRDKTWTQRFKRRAFRFQNPLRQNYAHIKAVESATQINTRNIHGLVVFLGACKFKTEIPHGVFRPRGLIPGILEHQDDTISLKDAQRIVRQFNDIKKTTTHADRRAHITHLKQRHSRA